MHVAQGATVDRGHLVVDAGANRSLVYTGATRGRDKNTIHVVTGAPDPAQPGRAERGAYADAAIRKAHELRQAGDIEGARAVSLRMPDRPSDRQMAPWEAVLAQALQQDQPERTALEEIAAAQDYATHTGHLLALSEAFWRLDVVPQIDQMVKERVTPGEYDRYMQDPERPAFLQALREHEIGGRRIQDVLDSITAAPLDGLRSIAAVLHGRAGKEPPPARGSTTAWAERAARAGSPEIAGAVKMWTPGRPTSAARPPPGRPRGRCRRGACPRGPGRAAGRLGAPRGRRRPPTGRSPGSPTRRRRSALLRPARRRLAEVFRSAVRALALPDDAALLKAMGQGELEAVVD